MRYLSASLFLLLVAITQAGYAHAFPERAIPGAENTLTVSPPSVCMWFNAELEPALSELTVKDVKGVTVSTGHSIVSEKDPSFISVALLPLPPGQYEVQWKAIALDGHKTEGSYYFTIVAAPKR